MTAVPCRRAVLTLTCPDRPGIVFEVARFLVDAGCTITSSQQFEDPIGTTFSMRVVVARVDGAGVDVDDLDAAFGPVASRLDMTWRWVDEAQRQRVLVMVSRYGHCLNDLLYRSSIGDLNVEICTVVSNHPDLEPLADGYGVPFRHVPVAPGARADAEAQLLDIVRDERVELVVLARYMQILSDEVCKHLEGRAINIHHSMLPSFKGARPYHQAYERGVKLIGATAHYVTADLDEGPIIEQEVVRVDHTLTAEQLAARGRDVECRALARAVRWHTEGRVVQSGRRTIVLG